jgi:hypothetical protein
VIKGFVPRLGGGEVFGSWGLVGGPLITEVIPLAEIVQYQPLSLTPFDTTCSSIHMHSFHDVPPSAALTRSHTHSVHLILDFEPLRIWTKKTFSFYKLAVWLSYYNNAKLLNTSFLSKAKEKNDKNKIKT